MSLGPKDQSPLKPAPDKSELSDQDRIAGSIIGGAILGASLGGPPGAVIGGLIGWVLGDNVNQSKRKEEK